MIQRYDQYNLSERESSSVFKEVLNLSSTKKIFLTSPFALLVNFSIDSRSSPRDNRILKRLSSKAFSISPIRQWKDHVTGVNYGNGTLM
ncbi:hypothetical protein TNCV_4209131 [Trichonephila clavipes]|nr:hypothetical protein TNCV_4209131 [Trichonephila clavipes]